MKKLKRWPIVVMSTAVFVLSELALPSLPMSSMSSVFAGGWDEMNAPENMHLPENLRNAEFRFDYQFDRNTTEGFLAGDKIPWSDSYWPSYKGGLAHRYKVDKLPHRFLSKKQLGQMEQKEINNLSPAEKIDIYYGDYGYLFTRSELARTAEMCNHPDGSEWEGLCHGWASAAINYPEPRPVVMTNRDGIKIPFGSSDMKALLSYFQGEVCRGEEHMAGGRCEEVFPNIADGAAFEDINSGAFHVIITNLIGRAQQGFVMDRTTDQQVWNQPVFGYSYRILEENLQPDLNLCDSRTKKEVVVEMDVHWVAEIGASDEYYHGSEQEKDSLTLSTYKYTLELDGQEKIVGGRWLDDSQQNHPDFVWMKSREVFCKYPKWEKLAEIYNCASKYTGTHSW
ncbi:MAG: hypothetical protein HQK53_11870 [Oligoflexia bacterium]|nr:hypothetical protein [Oligoflexia bacterium]